MNEYFGKNIRNLRKNKNLTQEQFAESLGVSFQAVSRWENCVTYPDVELIPLIARFFGVTIDEIFGIPEENKKAEFDAMMNEIKDLIMDDIQRSRGGRDTATIDWGTEEGKAFIQQEFDRIIYILSGNED